MRQILGLFDRDLPVDSPAKNRPGTGTEPGGEPG